MLSARLLALFVVCVAVSCEDAFLSPCDMDDTECLRKSTQTFLSKTALGVPDYDIRAIDPMVIPALDLYIDEDHDMWNHFKNIKVIGLKNQDLNKFSMDKNAKAVELQTKVDLIIDGDITIEAKKLKKSLSGTFSIKASALGTAKYGYDFKTDDKQVAHFEVGPETITCQPIGDPDVKLNPELVQMLRTDPELQEEREHWRTSAKDNNKKILCAIVEKAYVTVVHNIRAAAKVLPKEAFLKGV